MDGNRCECGRPIVMERGAPVRRPFPERNTGEELVPLVLEHSTGHSGLVHWVPIAVSAEVGRLYRLIQGLEDEVRSLRRESLIRSAI